MAGLVVSVAVELKSSSSVCVFAQPELAVCSPYLCVCISPTGRLAALLAVWLPAGHTQTDRQTDVSKEQIIANCKGNKAKWAPHFVAFSQFARSTGENV